MKFSIFELADSIDQSLVAAASIEDAHRTNDLKLLESFRETTVILGLIDVAKSTIEEAHQIRKRISSALEHISADRLIAAPDCGLRLLKRQLAREKLKNLCNAAHSF